MQSGLWFPLCLLDKNDHQCKHGNKLLRKLDSIQVKLWRSPINIVGKYLEDVYLYSARIGVCGPGKTKIGGKLEVKMSAIDPLPKLQHLGLCINQ